MSDKIFVRELSIQCNLGVPEEERQRPQPVTFDLELRLDLANAGASDSIHDTVNYAHICKTLHRVVAQKPYCTLEGLAETVAAAIHADFPRVETILLYVEKPLALAKYGARCAAVQIER